MKEILILGGGTAGTMMANYLTRKMKKKCNITIVDKHPEHYYQPGFLFIPFGTYQEKDIVKPKKKFIPKSVNFIQKGIDKIDADNNQVILENKETLKYDVLIIATGCQIVLSETEGLKGDLWHKDIFDFYTIEGSNKLAERFKNWEGGKLVVNLTEMPIKCPVAPLEFLFLADSFFRKKGIRDKVEIEYVTPLPGAFTKPKASKKLQYLLESKGIKVTTDFAIGSVNNEEKSIEDFGGGKINFDILVSIPTNMGADVIERSGLGDDLNFVPTNKHTLQSEAKENIFVIGDATNLPASKAGSVAHFEADVLMENLEQYFKGEEMTHKFDGHANCFIESGNGKGLLIDFNYEQEPVEGTFPIPGVGPLSLLKETRMNHFGKMMFKWVYWNMLLPAKKIPMVTTHMTKKGKKL